ncbi:MAG: chorismate synthase [Victivallales bacterium]|nr:chorismate synthase [Victivallales bacterium]
MERRAPGRDKLSTARHEPDLPKFVSGFADGRTTGERIEAVILNTDVRKKDYGEENTVPRPGHADYPQWVKTGRIASGGGANSGRMTAPMCIAGGICLQWLAKRNVTVEGRLVSVGGKTEGMEEEILKAKGEGDSVGGVIEIRVEGLPAGLGGAMFDGVESELSAALFGVPGVKGVEFGAGFRAAAMRGSEHNDPFAIEDGRVVTKGNNHGGLLGGMTTGMPLVVRLAMKPTPSIFKEQKTVDLATGEETTKTIQGRHDPCIARRAIPVAEALTAFVMADIMLAAESETPRICLTLTDGTLEQAFDSIKASRPFIDIVELRVDCLSEAEYAAAASFPKRCGLPVILTIRRTRDGGHWGKDEDTRKALYARLLKDAEAPFAFVDFEDDFRHPELDAIAKSRGTRIIRSLHDFDGPVTDVVARCQTMKGSTDDIPKIAFKALHCSDLTRLFNETADFTGFPHILCAMGSLGLASRILAVRTHSMLTFASPKKNLSKMRDIGHLTPETLVRTYCFRSLTTATPLYAVTGWPLGHTASPELNNSAFVADANPAVMVPIAAETAGEAIACAEALGVRGMAVTIPHKGEIMKYMASIDETAKAIGAVNTVVKTAAGWKGFNTDADGFTAALLEFLQVDCIAGRKVALLGAGGAARAVAYALHRMEADVCIFNHTYEKAVALAGLYGFKSAPLEASSRGMLSEYADIVVQATSVGLNATTADADPILFYDFKGTESIYDLVYVPAVTPIMERAAAAGCRTCSGMSMLIEQARVQRRLYAEESI